MAGLTRKVLPRADKVPVGTQDSPGSSQLLRMFKNRPPLLNIQQLMTMHQG